MRDFQAGPAHQTVLAQDGFDFPVDGGQVRETDVIEGAVIVKRQAGRYRRMAAPGDNDRRAFHQQAARVADRRGVQRADIEIDIAVVDHPHRPVALDVPEIDFQRRRIRGHEGRDLRRKEHHAVIQQADADLAVGQGRIEGPPRLENVLYTGQDVRDRPGDGMGERGRLHAGFCPAEQRVVEHRAQSFQSMTDRGLGHAQRIGGPGQVAVLVDRVEHREQVEIDGS